MTMGEHSPCRIRVLLSHYIILPTNTNIRYIQHNTGTKYKNKRFGVSLNIYFYGKQLFAAKSYSVTCFIPLLQSN